MRMLLKRGFFVVCLLLPLVAYGQKKWVFMPSAGTGPVWFFREPLEKPPHPGVVYNRNRLILWWRFDVAELAILNRDFKLGYHRVSFSHFGLGGPILRYGAGIARSRRYYFVSLSAGPTFFFYDTTVTVVDAEGEIRAFYMPWRAWGFGVTVNYSVPLSHLLEVKYTEPYLGISLILTGRID